MSANADDRAVARNALAGYGSWAINLAIGLLVTPIVLRKLGVEGFGAWTLALTLAGYVGIVELGLGVATVRFIASALAEADARRASVVAASARATYWALASLGTLALTILVLVPGLLGASEAASTAEVRLSTLVLGIGFLLTLAFTINAVIVQAAGRVDQMMTIGVVFRIITAVAQVIAVSLTTNLVPLALVTLIGSLGPALAARRIAQRVAPEIEIRSAPVDRTVVRELLGSGWRNAGLGITSLVAIQSDVLVVAAILGPTAVAAYGIAVRASVMVGQLSSRATDVLVPTFAHANALRDDRRTLIALRESALLTRAILVPSVIVLIFFGEQLLNAWLGSAPQDSNTVLILLLSCGVAGAPGHSCLMLLTGMNRLNFLLIGFTVTAVCNLGLSIVLTNEVGIVGPALASLMAFLVFNMIVLPRHVSRMLSVPWVTLSFVGVRTLGLPAIAATGAGAAARFILGGSGPMAGIVGPALIGLVYVGALALSVGPTRRKAYARLVGGAIRSGRG